MTEQTAIQQQHRVGNMVNMGEQDSGNTVSASATVNCLSLSRFFLEGGGIPVW